MHEQEKAGGDLLRKVIPKSEKRQEKGEGRGEFSLRGLVGKRDSWAGCLRGRIVVRFLAHLARESYFEWFSLLWF